MKSDTSTPTPTEVEFEPSEIVEAYQGLHRNLLHFWGKRPKANLRAAIPHGARGKKKNPRIVCYREDQLPALATLSRCYRLGLNTDHTATALGDSSVIRRLMVSPLIILE